MWRIFIVKRLSELLRTTGNTLLLTTNQKFAGPSLAAFP
jgi:hypothetical protein